jgi:hypothetical protein
MTLQRWAVRLALGRCRFDEVGLVAGILHRFRPTFDQDGDTFALEVHLEALTAQHARAAVQHELDQVPITVPAIESMVAVRAPTTPASHADETTSESGRNPLPRRSRTTPGTSTPRATSWSSIVQ